MVWIYGGGMRLGESGTPLYDGVGLAHHGVVIVSFNYRLAFLGYFAHPALAAESPTDPIGNYGLMDQVAALKWVRANISRFGGDPRNVTIFGESAGGQSVDDSMISPLARGLFHKAIAESSLGLADMTDRTDAVQLAIRVASDLGVSGNDQVALAKLRALSVADIMDAFNKVSATNYTLPSQMVDGRLIPDQVARLFAEGRLARVPFIIGSNSDEGGAMAALGISPDRLTAALGDESAAVRALYEQSGPISDADFLRQFFGDQLFGAGAQALAGYVVRSGQLAYVYNFAYVADARRGATGGVGHGGELPFVFGVHGLEHTPMGGMLARAMTDKDRRMIDLVQTYWTNFAKTGDPNSAGMPPWPRYSIDRQSTLVLNDEMTAVPHFRAAYYAPAYVAWSKRSGQPLPFPVTLGPLASRQPN